MQQLEQVLAEFGRDLGLEGLEPSANGNVQLRLASGALLGASTQGEEVVLHYAEPAQHDVARLLFKGMQRVARAESATDPVQIGCRSTPQGDWLVAGTRLPLARLDAREVHRLGGYLQAWLAQLR